MKYKPLGGFGCMSFTLVRNGVTTPFLVEEAAYSGVKKIVAKVCKDVERVTGSHPRIESEEILLSGKQEGVIVVGTIGHSSLLTRFEQEGTLNLEACKNKREVYQIALIKNSYPNIKQALVIAGSDKRGTIYGLYHLSELIGVSPLINWADAEPEHHSELIFEESIQMVSKEPSVKYRGFFINDEWPAFGNWTMEHFGGFTAEMYDMVFELLLRLKGNYLWPAMWSSSFSLDGPGLLSAQLADEYGIVMCNSHHEPCLRHSEEWDKVRGPESIYGNEWNYYTNREGLLRYWEDGLKRSGQFENVITIGMRGERDSSMLGPDATLKQNIDLLKDIITNQRELIHKHCEREDQKASQMLALYKEVEAYFYGDEHTEGLRDWDGLDGVTFMLCEDNFGNMRTLPTPELRERDGGWGMYYHFDYHGGPVSYEWVNSTYLPKVWEQMAMAYDFGIRDIWIVNVGDIKFNELPLNYFMDLAYDFDTYGTHAPNETDTYTRNWIKRQFPFMSDQQQNITAELIHDYTKTNHNRKPEALTTDTYHPTHFGEAVSMLQLAEKNSSKANALLHAIPETQKASFYELVYYPAVASFNVLRMQLLAGQNKLMAHQGRKAANSIADEILKCIKKDRELTANFHGLLGGKWNGMALSQHIGFVNWNDEGCVYPIIHRVEPVNTKRMIVTTAWDEDFSTGGDWSAKTIYMNAFLQKDIESTELIVANGGAESFSYRIECENDLVSFSATEGTVLLEERILVSVDRAKLVAQIMEEPCDEAVSKKEVFFFVRSEAGNVKVIIPIEVVRTQITEAMTFLPNDNYISIEAVHYAQKADTETGQFLELKDYGKTLAGMKAFPSTTYFEPGVNAPSITYQLWVPQSGSYDVVVYSAPGNPVRRGNNLCFGLQINHNEIMKVSTVSQSFDAGTNGCREWEQGVLNQIHITKKAMEFKQGMNTLTIYAMDPAFVLEKIVVAKDFEQVPESYLGPRESIVTD